MDLPYDELDTESLNQLLEAHRVNLKVWIGQTTKHGDLHAPANLLHQINDTKEHMQKIKLALELKKDHRPTFDINKIQETNKADYTYY